MNFSLEIQLIKVNSILLFPINELTVLQKKKKHFNQALSSIRVLVEHIFGDIKIFKCLCVNFRHEFCLHPVIFRVLCNVVNIQQQFSS